MSWLFSIAAFSLGAIVGSFLNVVIHRYPRGESVVLPPSHCPHCNTLIRPYDNIPILSWLILLGRCRACREPITARYPLVELANALFYLAIFQRTGLSVAFLPLAAIVSMTIALIYIDLDIQILPDVIDLPGAAIGLAMGALHVGALVPDLTLSATLLESVAGAAAGAGILLAIGMTYKLVRKIEGMGLGDVKMMAMLGAVMGWEPVMFILVLASTAGAIIGIAIALRSSGREAAFGVGMQTALPFGVFLGIAALVMLFFGRAMMDAVLPWFAGSATLAAWP